MLTWQDFPRKSDRIALVGFADTTKDLTPWNDPNVEIMGLNEGYSFPWMKRWDRWMQIHPGWDLARNNNQNDPNHLLWLRNEEGDCLKCKAGGKVIMMGGDGKPVDCPACGGTGHYQPKNRTLDIPIYMQKADPRIPGSVALPLKEIEEFLIPPGNNQRNYFTSSFSYMFGLVCLMGYPRVEIYGFEMGAESEFHYQRANAEYLIGLAQGKGIEVVLPRNSNLLTGPFYAYRNMQMGYRQNLEMRTGFLKNQLIKEEAKLSEIQGRIKAMVEFKIEEEKIHAEEIQQAKQISLVNGIRYCIQEVSLMTQMYDAYFWKGTEGGDDDNNPQYGAPSQDEINKFVTIAYSAG